MFMQPDQFENRVLEAFLSHDVASGSEITPCNEIDKPLVVNRLVRNLIPSIIMLLKRWQHLDVFTPKM